MLRAERTLVWLTMRQLLTRRRALAVLLLAVVPAIIAALYAAREAGDVAAFIAAMHDALLLRIVVPVIALIFGVGAFGADRDAGTAVYVLTRPVPRWRIAFVRLKTAAVLTLALSALAALLMVVAGLRGFGTGGLAIGVIAGAALTGAVYAWLFGALGLLVRRAMFAGIGYIVLWESLAVDQFAGARSLSIRHFGMSVAAHFAEAQAFATEVPLRTALVTAIVVILVALAVAVYRLAGFEVTEQE
jgi:ABC-2 type transport system permease protein